MKQSMKQPAAEFLIREYEAVDQTAFEDLFLILAKNVEESLKSAGAVPGTDYTILDCYKLAQPFVLEAFQKSERVTFTTSWPNRK